MRYTVFFLLLILSLLVNKSYSTLKLYDNFNNELASFYNVDLPNIENISYAEIKGKLFIASFDDDNDPCKISVIPGNIDILFVPFLQALKLGCSSYENVLLSNSWVNTPSQNFTKYSNDPKFIPRASIIELSRTLFPSPINSTPNQINLIKKDNDLKRFNFISKIFKEFGIIKDKIKKHIQKVSKRIEEFITCQKRDLTSYAPKIIIFSSSHDGIPGIREQYNGDINVLKTSTLSLTLINIEDSDKLIKIANEITYVEISTEQGPWIDFLHSDPWQTFSIIMGVLYFLIIMIVMFLFPRTYMNLGCAFFNPKFWIYPGIGIICSCSFVILEIDPGDIEQDKLSLITRELLCEVRSFLLTISYILLHMSWKTVSKKICKEKRSSSFPIIHTIYKIIQPISALTFIVCFVLRAVYEIKLKLMPINLLRIAYIMEAVALGLIGLGLFLFGNFTVLALKKLQRTEKNNYSKILFMTFFMVISVVFYIGSKYFTFLELTVENFKLEQFSNNIMTVFCCLTMTFVLEDKLIGHYLPSNRDDNLNPPESHNLIALTTITSSDIPSQPLPQSPLTDTTLITETTLVAAINDPEVNTNV
ncbi:hypothetical protein GLOIN_2v1590460 [Rhizophagus clarus]|uniref:G-protein coupled receptors family 3 profile domain-containing protein n=1 Tax=Rhizophagus clarus TaxID=94130 RepID=A0A8H3R3V4_9GLOM|nr:hypothetical protein GLOIN_2v1590460 [Rhizophagus clarus]